MAVKDGKENIMMTLLISFFSNNAKCMSGEQAHELKARVMGCNITKNSITIKSRCSIGCAKLLYRITHPFSNCSVFLYVLVLLTYKKCIKGKLYFSKVIGKVPSIIY